MNGTTPRILFGTVLIEANRWTPAKQPSLKISEWAEAIAASGFTGLELGENHAAAADDRNFLSDIVSSRG